MLVNLVRSGRAVVQSDNATTLYPRRPRRPPSTARTSGRRARPPPPPSRGRVHHKSADIYLSVLNNSYDRMHLWARSVEMGT